MNKSNERAKVYYTGKITPESVVKMYHALGIDLPGKVGVKLHSGETGNQNFIRPEFLQAAIKEVNGIVVECNTAYDGTRNTTKAHWETMKSHGWAELFDVDIMDEGGEIALPVNYGGHLQNNYVGKSFFDYDSMLILSHFKGHPMGGFGGAIKNISIGLASSHGKANIHGAGKPEEIWSADHDSFLESMAEAAGSVMEAMHGKIAYVNIMKNMSVDCDCCAVAEDPMLADIGILSSLDPVALDKACVDLVYSSSDEGKKHLIERMESRNGIHTLDRAAELGIGSLEYELINID